MNPLNYGSLPACQRLVAKGIVLDTDCVWCPVTMIPKQSDTWILITKQTFNKDYFYFDPQIPAPSMSEIWRELPKWVSIIHLNSISYARYKEDIEFESDNPTDALIDLLIWVRSPEEDLMGKVTKDTIIIGR